MSTIASRTFNYAMAHAILSGEVRGPEDFARKKRALEAQIEPSFGPISAADLARFDGLEAGSWRARDRRDPKAREVAARLLVEATALLGFDDPKALGRSLLGGLKDALYEAVPLPGGRTVRLLDVNDDIQSTDYSCGPTALKSVLRYFGHEVAEVDLIEELGTTPEAGTPPEAIAAAAARRGLSAEVKVGMTIEDLERAVYPVAPGEYPVPVIIDIQAWREDRDVEWAKRWEDGHYVVVIGLDDRFVYFEDPSLEGSQGKIPRGELLRRWHDYEGESPERGKKYIRSGILIRGQEPKTPRITRIE